MIVELFVVAATFVVVAVCVLLVAAAAIALVEWLTAEPETETQR